MCALLRGRIDRRRALAGSAGLLAAGFAACGRSANRGSTGAIVGTASSSAVAGGTLNVYVNYNTPLDPQKTTAAVHLVVAGVYSRVFRFKTALDPKVATDHDLQNELGVSAETPDGVTWTIKLRPDARFTSRPPVGGRPVQAEDVKATFARAVDAATANPNRGGLDMIDPSQIQTPDATTVVFKLNYPYAPFSHTLASPSYSLILPREGATGGYDLSRTAVGSGPLVLDSAVPDVAYTYKKNSDYFEKNMPWVDGVRLAVVPDASQQLAQFTGGNLDEMSLDSPYSLATARQSNPKASLVQIPGGNTYCVYYQMGQPNSIFQDIRVRRAFNMALDRQTLGKVTYGDEAATYAFLPGYMGRWSLPLQNLPSDTLQYYRYDASAAKQLLNAAGFDFNRQFKLTYANRIANPAFITQLQTISNMYAGAGIKANIVEVDYDKDWIAGGKGINGGYYADDTLPFTGYSVFTEADEWIFGFLDSKTTQSHINVKDAKLDAMIAKERATLDDAERVKTALDIQKYVADQAYFVPGVGDAYTDTLVQPRVRNYQATTTPAKLIETYAQLWLAV
jgi:peptide/nickel transport system substrate-binding protein